MLKIRHYANTRTVGNENTSGYGLIDKAVQRDVLTGLPSIYASSLRGAINEYCTQVVHLKPENIQKGAYTFFDASLLLLPVQDDRSLYHWVTSMSIINRLKEQLDIFGINIPGVTDENTLLNTIKEQCIDREICVVSDDVLNQICSDTELPIIARNRLENGKSTNLWYEQVLPPQTVFYTFLLSDEDKLTTVLENKIIQIGANTTIGYGCCVFTKMFWDNG